MASSRETTTQQQFASQQLALHQRLDQDISALLENFSSLVKASRITDTVKNHQERLQIDVQAAKVVSAGDSLLDLCAQLKQGAVLSDFPAINKSVAERGEAFNALSDKAEDALDTIATEAAAALHELEAHYYESDPRYRAGGGAAAREGHATAGGEALRRIQEIAATAPDTTVS